MAATLFSSCRTGSGTQRAAPSHTLRYAPAWTPEPVRGDERGVAALPIPPPASEFIGEFGDDFVEVATEADVGDLEEGGVLRSAEHPSVTQYLMRNSNAVLCLKK